MNDYISKPIDEKLLFDKINESTSALELNLIYNLGIEARIFGNSNLRFQNLIDKTN
jgi:hypothetical protein